METFTTLALFAYMILNFSFRQKGGPINTLGIMLVQMLLEGIEEEKAKLKAKKEKETPSVSEL